MSEKSVTPPPAAPFTVAGPWILLSGQVGVDKEWQPVMSSIEDETRAAFENLRANLQNAGADLSAVVKITAYLSDFTYFSSYNTVWSEVFGSTPPARTTVQAGLHPPFRVELDAMAYRPRG